jgi:hypothetical protein
MYDINILFKIPCAPWERFGSSSPVYWTSACRHGKGLDPVVRCIRLVHPTCGQILCRSSVLEHWTQADDLSQKDALTHE